MNIKRIITTKPDLRNDVVGLLESNFYLAKQSAELNYDNLKSIR